MTGPSHKAVVIIPNWNGERWLPRCLAALDAQTTRDFHVILVDNGSTDGSLALVAREHPDVEILRMPENRGFAAAVNAGIRQSNTEYVVLLNNDTEPRPRWLATLIETIERAPENVGSLASRMLNMENPETIDSAGDLLTRHGAARKRGHGESASLFDKPVDVLSPCAGAALYRRTFLRDVGLFDETFFAYLEDVDLGLRGRLKGYRCLFVPDAEVLHHGHGSGLAQGRYARMITRNRLLLLFKNLPAAVLKKNARHILYGQLYFLIAYRRPLHVLAGMFDFLRRLPHARKERLRLQKTIRVDTNEILAWLAPDFGEPPLRKALARKLSGRP